MNKIAEECSYGDRKFGQIEKDVIFVKHRIMDYNA